MTQHPYRKFIWLVAILVAILLVGTIGYWLIENRQVSIIDAVYMSFITIATIGYSEVIDLSANPGGRIFTIILAVGGIGVLAYTATSFIAFIVEGQLTQSFKRRRMEKRAGKLSAHYIVCGSGTVGRYIVDELKSTGRKFVVVEDEKSKIEKLLELFPKEIIVEGDATSNETLVKAGVSEAEGLFSITGDDNQNLVVCLTARQLNKDLRIIAECKELANGEKLKRAGADAYVSATNIGALRMASEMVRPAVVSFLDVMLRDQQNLRVEEVIVPEDYPGKSVGEAGVKTQPHSLLLAIKTSGEWVYNPPEECIIKPADTLVFMMTPEARTFWEDHFKCV